MSHDFVATPRTKADHLALALTILVWLSVFIPFLSYRGFDDAHITFRHSYNLATGHGLVYNAGEAFLGTSAPGFALLLAFFSWPWPAFIPLVANIISGLALLGCGLALLEYGRHIGTRFLGFLVALLFVTCPLAAITMSGEMLVQCALILWAFVIIVERRPMIASLLLAAACIVRPDSAIAVLAAFPLMALTERRMPWKEFVIFLAIACFFYALIWLYYGSPIPGSMIAKSQQRQIGLWNDFWVDAPYRFKLHVLPLSSSRWSGPRATPEIHVVIYLLVIGLVGTFIYHRKWLKLMLWSGLLALFFTVTNPPLYHWYLLPLLVPFVILAGVGVDTFVRLVSSGFRALLRNNTPAWTTRALQLGASLLLTPALISQVFASYEFVKPGRVGYIEIAKWLNSHVPPGTSVNHFEIGYLGFYSPQLRIIDTLGLVHPGIAKEVASGDTLAAIKRYDPDVILQHGIFNNTNVTRMPGFDKKYVLVASFNGDVGLLGAIGNIYDIYMKRDLARRQNLPEAKTIRTPEQIAALEKATRELESPAEP